MRIHLKNLFIKRLRMGRFSVYLEPRDVWVGVYFGPGTVYICIVPMLVFRIDTV
jgi:hypothetical protein